MKLRKITYKDIEQIPSLRVNKEFKINFQGNIPAPFIGKYNYPNVNVGILSPQFVGETSHYDSPSLWSRGNFTQGTIGSLRYGLVNSRTQGNIKSLRNRFVELIQEAAMAKHHAQAEIQLHKKPSLHTQPEREISPFGPQAKLLNATITSNTKIDTRVQRVYDDTDLKAAPALLSLYKKGFEESELNKILSVGALGIGKNRKLVPTRWSITATDDTVGKELIKEVKDFQIGSYQVYFGGAWGNYYLMLFYPNVWSYELFETYLPHQAYSSDYESYRGRKEYASNTAGGYYAPRLAILEKMKQLKRQHACLALRFISEEYKIPLGVWVCREAARKSLHEKPLYFDSASLMEEYARQFIKKKFGFDLDLLFSKSKLLKERYTQTKLFEFN